MEIPAFGRRASALLALLAALSLVVTGSGFSTAAAPTGSAGVVGPQLRFRTVRR